MDEITGLRERKKAATRLALHESALRLAAEQGPDGVTIEAIADAANVSRRTFSNYFSSKEEALFTATRCACDDCCSWCASGRAASRRGPR